MKFFKLFLPALLLSGCSYIQPPPAVHTNDVANQLSLIADTTLAIKLLAPPPKGMGEIGLVKNDTVLYTATVDSNAKQGDVIYIHYPFKNKVHYSILAIGQGIEYYDMHAYDLTLDLKTHAILGLHKIPLLVKK